MYQLCLLKSNCKPSNCQCHTDPFSSLATAEHTRETDNTRFIRAATGRGSIKRGPAPTKASQLREMAKQEKLRREAEEQGGGEYHSPDCGLSGDVTAQSPVRVFG